MTKSVALHVLFSSYYHHCPATFSTYVILWKMVGKMCRKFVVIRLQYVKSLVWCLIQCYRLIGSTIHNVMSFAKCCMLPGSTDN